jgi:hypothetical protein
MNNISSNQQLKHAAQPWLLKEPHGVIPEDGILHSLRRENLISYIALTGWSLAET